MKTLKSIKQAHTADTQIGMGDYYGPAIKQKMGTMKSYMNTPSKPIKKNVPRSLA